MLKLYPETDEYGYVRQSAALERRTFILQMEDRIENVPQGTQGVGGGAYGPVTYVSFYVNCKVDQFRRKVRYLTTKLLTLVTSYIVKFTKILIDNNYTYIILVVARCFARMNLDFYTFGFTESTLENVVSWTFFN